MQEDAKSPQVLENTDEVASAEPQQELSHNTPLGQEIATQNMSEELTALRNEFEALNDKYLRKLADEVNFRKRLQKEKEDSQRFALGQLVADLIPILDDFSRAISSSETGGDFTLLLDGINLTKRQLEQVLESKYGLKKIISLGSVFDPNCHEAIATIPASPEYTAEDILVCEEFLPGYILNDRIIRTAKVKVMMPAAGKPISDDVGASPAQI